MKSNANSLIQISFHRTNFNYRSKIIHSKYVFLKMCRLSWMWIGWTVIVPKNAIFWLKSHDICLFFVVVIFTTIIIKIAIIMIIIVISIIIIFNGTLICTITSFVTSKNGPPCLKWWRGRGKLNLGNDREKNLCDVFPSIYIYLYLIQNASVEFKSGAL